MTTARAAAVDRDTALAAERSGDIAGAIRCFETAVKSDATDASILNSAGSFFARRGNHDRALALFERALEQRPSWPEAILNKAIALSGTGQSQAAALYLAGVEADFGRSVRYWSIRAGAERGAGHLTAARRSYDRCLDLEQNYPRAVLGRARIALERQEPDALSRFEAALALQPSDGELWLGQAQAAQALGQPEKALIIAETLVAQAPHWVDALELLSQLRWEAGDTTNFADHYIDAATQTGRDPVVMLSWCRMLAGADLHDQAATVAADGGRAHPADERLALAEASYAGMTGDDGRATAIFARLLTTGVDRKIQEGRHWLRCRDPIRAERLLGDVVEDQSDHIVAWALRDLAWRLVGDMRHEWLHGQVNLMSVLALDIDAEISDITALLDEIHDRSAAPIGQSVRHGTQTRGGLFDRVEPVLQSLQRTIATALERHRAALPPYDRSHPLLRLRDTPWRISGSWSVRLTQTGWHAEHIHPNGILSSALYLVTPPVDLNDPLNGALELGGAPADLRLSLPPLRTIMPQPGKLVLFPSTLYHATRRFNAGHRTTVAFDVSAVR